MRPTWDEYFIKMLDDVSARATCDRGRSSAIIVKDNRILATGFVGSPSGLPHCDDIGHELINRKEYHNLEDKPHAPSIHCIRTIHAEMNAILNCARNGISCFGATLYISMVPCRVCAMSIIQAGIIRVVAKNRYHKDEATIIMFEKVGIKLEVLSDKLSYVP